MPATKKKAKNTQENDGKATKKKAKKTQENDGKETKTRAERRAGWVDWTKTEARKILLNDLRQGHIPLYEEEMSVKEAWEVYKDEEGFEEIQYDQFEARLVDHRVQIAKQLNRAIYEKTALEHDRKLYPHATHNERGQPVFDLSVAKLLLRSDVLGNKHTSMSFAEFYYSWPEYHKVFARDVFQRCIIQEVK